jgi:hypothetical protein
MEEGEIINRVASSSLLSIDLDEMLVEEQLAIFDIAPALFKGMILKEGDFREYIKNYSWTNFEGKWVGIVCSADAIIPMWSYMLITSKLSGVAKGVVFGDEAEVEKEILKVKIDYLIKSNIEGLKVVVKGCSKLKSSEWAFTYLTHKLVPIVSSLMYGEPCSTVPVFKRGKARLTPVQ